MKTKTIIKLAISFIFAFISTEIIAIDSGEVKFFEKQKKPDYVLDDYIQKTIQDKQGFIWSATTNGLVRYDGYEIVRYKNNVNEPFSISDNMLENIIEDDEDVIWVATRYGLNRFDRKTGKFHRYFHKVENKTSIADNQSYSFFIDANNDMWVGTHNGLSLYHRESDNFSNYLINKDQYGLKNNLIRSIAQTEECCLWLGTDYGLIYFNKELDKVEHYSFSQNENFRHSSNRVWDIVVYDGYLWLATFHGLIKFYPQKRISEFTPKHFNKSKIYSLNIVSNDLWLTEYPAGLYRYNLITDLVAMYGKRDQGGEVFFNENYIDIYIDNSGFGWLGRVNGYKRFYPNSAFENYPLVDVDQKSLSTRAITKLFILDGDDLWLRYNDKVFHVSQWRKQSSESISYYLFDDKYLVRNRMVKDRKNRLWINAKRKIFLYDRANKKWIDDGKHYQFINKNILSNIQGMHPGNYGVDLWFATYNFGFTAVDMSKMKARYFNKDNSGLPNNDVLDIVEDAEGDLWIATYAGLAFYDRKNSLVSHIKGNRKLYFENVIVNDLVVNADNNVWVATENGLYFVYKENKKIKSYVPDVNENIGYIDKLLLLENILWMCTEHGLRNFNITEKRFSNIYHYEALYESLKCTELNYDGEGLLVLGTSRGIMTVDINGLMMQHPKPKIQLTEVSINNKRQNDSFAYSLNQRKSESLILSHDDYMLSVKFSVLDYIASEKNRYAYRLKGLEGEWNYGDANNRQAVYTTLPAGDYEFQFKGSSVHHVWSDTRSIAIHVLPPWWKTYYAYAVYVFLLVMSIITTIMIRTRQLSRQAKILQVLVDDRTEEIQNLLKKKNDLFANVSHELRTPLTLILEPINQLIENNNNPKQQKLLQLVKRNSQRLLHMVEQLLDIARITSPTKKQQNTYDFSNIVKLLLDSMQSLFDEKQLALNANIEKEIYVTAVSDSLETMALNLISNAVKYTEEGGVINVKLFRDDMCAKLIVKDSGVGIAKKDQQSIFERFERVDNEHNRYIPGTGIGLALVKDLAEFHDGSILVNSELEQGSEFILSLPLAEKNDQVELVQITSTPQSEAGFLQETMTLKHQSSEVDTVEYLDKQGKANVLVIEDTPDMRNYLQEILGQRYHCTVAVDGKAGLEHARHELPDIIVCDVMMPGIDGFEVLRVIREDKLTSHIPLILLTAKGDRESRLKGLDQLADDYIAKPFEKDHLFSRIENLRAVRQIVRNHLLQQFMDSDYPYQKNQEAPVENKQIFLQEFHQLIENNFANPDYSVLNMATALNMSDKTLQKKLQSEISKNPREYLVIFRLKVAATLLKQTKLTITQVSEQSGFGSSSHFAYSFREQYAMSASEYRTQYS